MLLSSASVCDWENIEVWLWCLRLPSWERWCIVRPEPQSPQALIPASDVEKPSDHISGIRMSRRELEEQCRRVWTEGSVC